MPFTDYRVADISLADWGRREIAIAQTRRGKSGRDLRPTPAQ
jgi:hypothetical protein